MNGKEIQNDIIVIWILHCTVTLLCRFKEGRKPTLNVFWKTEESSAGK